MAISWSGWDYGTSGNEGFRVGVEVTVSAVSHSSSTVTITTKWYVEAMYNVNDSMTLTFGGSISGTDTQNLTTGSSGGYALFATKTYVYTYSTFGTSPGTRTFTASLSGVYNGANPSKSTTVTIPARPYGTPAPVTAVTAVRDSDAQATVSWTRHATTGEPYSSLTVQMRTFSGSTWGAWATVATTSAGAASYVKTGLSANRIYQFQVKANNAAGASAYAASGSVFMTPAAPSSVASVLNATGATVTTTWVNNAYVTTPATTFTVQRSVAGGAYANVATGLTTMTWTDPTPGAGTNRYRVAAVSGSGSLTSAFVEGNIITTIVAPLAPTLLAPNGTAVDFDRSQTFTWKHNHGGDAAAQSHYTLRYSSNGGSTWTTLANDVASTASSRVIPAGTLLNGVSYVWQVQTEGIVSGGYGPFSASATVTGSSTPVVTLSAPTDPQNTLPLTAAWDYIQDQGSPQTAWTAILESALGASILESRSGFDDSASVDFLTALVDGTDYRVRVSARSGAGVWSDWATRDFTFELLPPAAGHVEATYQPATGTTILSITSEAPVVGVTVAVDTAVVERRINGGPWVVLAQNLPVPNDFLDVLPITNGLNEYRVTTASTSPSYNVGVPVAVVPENPATPEAPGDIQWVFVNYGEDFSQLLRFRSEPEISEGGTREKALHTFLGRARPVPAFGDNANLSISVSGKLVFDSSGAAPDAFEWDSPPEDWTFAGRASDVICYRDFTGHRVFGIFGGDVQAATIRPGLGSVAFTVEEIDYEEPEGWVDRDDIPAAGDYVLDGGDAFGTGVTTFDGGSA